MKVIGAGLPRTGTTSLRLTLEALGVRPCHHMQDIWSDPSQALKWSEAINGHVDWRELLRGYEGAVDWPAAFHWKELLTVYPDSKVILTVRDGHQWASSIERTIWAVLFGQNLMRHLSCARAEVDSRWAVYRAMMKEMWVRSGVVTEIDAEFDTAQAIAAMERHNASVVGFLPSDQLLVWRPSEGIAPIAKFLGVDEIDWVVPFANTDQDFFRYVTSTAISVIQDSLLATAPNSNSSH